MAKVRGLAETRRMIRSLPAQIEDRLLRGAARVAAKVIADDARERVSSDIVRDAITVKTTVAEHKAKGLVTVKGAWARSLATWIEWGTQPHYIKVDLSQTGGVGAVRLNRAAGEDGGARAMSINGHFVSGAVLHPGARPHPFLRPARDARERDAIAAAQRYVNSRIVKGKIVGTDEGDEQ